MRVLGMDPGSVNFAWALIVDGLLVEHGYLIPVDGADFLSFGKRFKKLLDDTTPDAVIFERFMIRGSKGAGGAITAEPVNCMLGYIMRICDECNMTWYRITAAQWKNYYKNKKHPRPNYGLKSHEQDAACMGHYGETHWFDQFKKNAEATERKRLRILAKTIKAEDDNKSS